MIVILMQILIQHNLISIPSKEVGNITTIFILILIYIRFFFTIYIKKVEINNISLNSIILYII